jgi:hypothetical protein
MFGRVDKRDRGTSARRTRPLIRPRRRREALREDMTEMGLPERWTAVAPDEQALSTFWLASA